MNIPKFRTEYKTNSKNEVTFAIYYRNEDGTKFYLTPHTLLERKTILAMKDLTDKEKYVFLYLLSYGKKALRHRLEKTNDVLDVQYCKDRNFVINHL